MYQSSTKEVGIGVTSEVCADLCQSGVFIDWASFMERYLVSNSERYMLDTRLPQRCFSRDVRVWNDPVLNVSLRRFGASVAAQL